MSGSGADFDDGKEAGAMRTIGEVSAATGIKPHVLRYWESQFPSLKPLKRAGGRRLYRAEDVAIVKRIDSLINRQGYTLKGAKAALAGVQQGQAGTASAGHRPSTDPVDLLPRLRAIRSQLAAGLTA